MATADESAEERTEEPDERLYSDADALKLANSPIGRAILSLEMITTQLGTLGLVAAVATTLNVLVVMTYPFYRGSMIGEHVAILSAGITLVCCVCVVLFEMRRKRGDAIFHEISDEFQWNIRAEYAAKEERASKRPRFRYRVVLRDFVQSSDLLLTPGRFGPLIYIAVNFAIVVASLVLRYSSLYDPRTI